MSPELAAHREWFEIWLTKQLHHRVSFQAVELRWRGLYPLLEFVNLVIQDRKQQPFFQAQNFSLKLSIFSSLYNRQLVVKELWVEDSNLQIERKSLEKWLINHFEVLNEGMEISTPWLAFDWLFTWPNVDISHVRVEYHDELGRALHIENLAARLGDINTQHVITGSFSLQDYAATKIQFTISLPIEKPANDFSDIKFYLDSKELLLAPLKPFLPNNDFDLQQGIFNAKIWGERHANQWDNIQTLLDLKEIIGTYQQQTFAINALKANGLWHALDGGGWMLTADNMHAVVNQIGLGTNQLTFMQLPSTSKEKAFYGLVFDQVLLRAIKPFIPVSAGIINLKGKIYDGFISYDAENPQSLYQAQAVVEDVLLQLAKPDVTFTGAAGDIYVDPDAIHVSAHANRLKVFSKEQLEYPLRFNNLAGEISWFAEQDGKHLQWQDVHFTNSDLTLQSSGVVLLPNLKEKPYINMTVEFAAESATSLNHYYPLSMDDDLRPWLMHSILSTAPLSARVVWRGPIAEFPYLNNQGVMEAEIGIENASLRFDPDWPTIHNLQTDIYWHNQGIFFNHARGKIGDIQIENLSAAIEELQKGGKATLAAVGKIETDLAIAQDFIEHSPLDPIIGKKLSFMRMSGKSLFDLGLKIPLHEEKRDVEVNGEIQLQSAKVFFPAKNASVNDLQGTVTFTEKKIASNWMSAKTDATPLQLRLATDNPQSARPTYLVDVKGNYRAEDLTPYLPNYLADKISGKSTFSARVFVPDLKNKRWSAEFESDLQGIKTTFPAPFAKRADQKFASKLSLKMPENDETALHFKYGSFIQGDVKLIQKNSWQFVSGSFRLNNLKSIFPINQIDLNAVKQDKYVKVTLNGSYAQGEVLWPLDNKYPLICKMKKLVLGSVNSQQKLKLSELPNIDFRAENLVFKNKQLGEVQFRFKKNGNTALIYPFTMRRPTWQMSGSLNWNASGNGYSQFKGNAVSKNLGASLQDLDLPSVVLARQAQFQGQLQWSGSPADFSLKNLQGDIHLALHNGLVVEHSEAPTLQASKVLTFLSANSLRRRMSLDFSDMSQKGFSFDRLQGDFKLTAGNAFTQNTYLDGPMAYISLYGRIGIAKQDFDAHLNVIPYLSSTLPVVATLAAGPVAGVMTWVANRFVSPAVNQIVTRVYTMKGSWQRPEIELVYQQQGRQLK